MCVCGIQTLYSLSGVRTSFMILNVCYIIDILQIYIHIHVQLILQKCVCITIIIS